MAIVDQNLGSVLQGRSGPGVFEFEFLCCLVRPLPDTDRASKLVAGGLDWKRVTNLASMHGVRPQLLRALKQSIWRDAAREIVPGLEAFQRVQAVRNLDFTRELLDIADAFDAAGIDFATFKGVALALSLYGDLAQREFNDIDILVHKKDREAAERILVSCGFRARYGTSEYRRAFIDYQRQNLFDKAQSSVLVDLHWDFVTEGTPFPIHPEDIWDRLAVITIAGRQIATLGAEDLALFLAGHGTKEKWRSLGWVCDFALFVASNREIDWREISARAKQRNCGRPILIGGALISRLMGVRISQDTLIRANDDGNIRALTDSMVAEMMEVPCQGQAVEDTNWPDLVLCETIYQRSVLLWHLVFARTTSDFETMPLPRGLWRLYHLTRPFRLAARVLSARYFTEGSKVDGQL
jgi:hypothetical protein